MTIHKQGSTDTSLEGEKDQRELKYRGENKENEQTNCIAAMFT